MVTDSHVKISCSEKGGTSWRTLVGIETRHDSGLNQSGSRECDKYSKHILKIESVDFSDKINMGDESSVKYNTVYCLGNWMDNRQEKMEEEQI